MILFSQKKETKQRPIKVNYSLIALQRYCHCEERLTENCAQRKKTFHCDNEFLEKIYKSLDVISILIIFLLRWKGSEMN